MPEVIDNFYDNEEEATFRLRETLIEYNKEPVYVTAVETHADGVLRLKIFSLPVSTNSVVRKQITSPLFKRFRPLEIGFVNFFSTTSGSIGPNCALISRIGARRAQQGLSRQNMRADTLKDGPSGCVDFHWLLEDNQEAIKNAMNNVFPSYTELLDVLPVGSSAAVSSEYAILRKANGVKYLYRRLEEIGLFLSGNLFLFENKQFFKEEILATNTLPNTLTIGA